METAEVLGPIAPTCTSPLADQENVDCDVRIVIDTMTGGRFVLLVSNFLQIHSLRNLVAKKLNVLPDKICLLHKDSVLSSGTLMENGLCDLSTIRVFLSMETGTKEAINSASCSKKVGAISEATTVPEINQQDFFNHVEAKQFDDFLAGNLALTVAVKTENHTLLIQLKINSAITGPHVPVPAKNAGKSGTVVDRLEQIAPGVVQGAFSGTIPIRSSPQTGATFIPVDTVTDIVRDLVTFSAKAIGVPEVAASIANNAEQCISCCGFSAPDSNAIENVNPSSCFNALQSSQTAVPGHSSSSQLINNNPLHQNREDSSALRKVEAGKVQKASRLSSSSNRHRHSAGQPRRKSRSNSTSSSSSSSSGSSRSRRSSGSSDKYNEVTRMKMSLLRAMLSK